jgi:hypothetical protein
MLLEGATGDGWPPIIAAFPVFIRRSSPPHLSSCLAGRGGRSWGFSHVTDPAGRSGVRAGSAPDTCLLLTSRYRGAVTEKPSPLASSPQPSRPPTRRGRSLAGETQALPSGRTPRALAVGSGGPGRWVGTCGSVYLWVGPFGQPDPRRWRDRKNGCANPAGGRTASGRLECGTEVDPDSMDRPMMSSEKTTPRSSAGHRRPLPDPPGSAC